MQLKPQRAEYEFYMYAPTSVEVDEELVLTERKVIKVIDFLGREIQENISNFPVIKIYDDGSVEKKLIID